MINLIIKDSNEQVISLDILKNHLRIAHNHEDKYLNSIIGSATNVLESELHLSLLHKTYNCVIDNYSIHYPIELPITNVINIEYVKDEQNNELSFSTNNKYEIILNNISNKSPINIKYTAGFTNNVEEIPKDLKLSILQISKNIYDNSENDIFDSKYIQTVINKYKQLHI